MKKTILLLCMLLPLTLCAQQYPVAVEPAALLEPGHALINAGLSHFRNQPFPLSGISGNLTKYGNLFFRISLSPYVELQTEGTLLNVLNITRRSPAFNASRVTSANPTADIGDFTVWTKFSLLNEYTAGIGCAVRFGVQLPNASNESGLGVDEMNFYVSALLQKHSAGCWTLNAGLGILSDPAVVGQQHDVFMYAMEYAIPVASSTLLLVQTAGRTGHEGIGVHRLANGKAGVEQSFGGISVKIVGVSNFTPDDNAKGIECSVSYLFHIVDISR